MCDTVLVSDAGRRPAATSFDLAEDFIMDDFHDALDTPAAALASSKRGRDDLDLDFIFLEDGPAPSKKTRVEDDAAALLGVRLEDDLDTAQFALDMEDFPLFDDVDDFVQMTPPRAIGRAVSTSTPPLSPRANVDEVPILRSASVLSLLSSRALSGMSVLSDDLQDMDTIPDRVDEADLAPAMSPRNVATAAVTRPADLDSRIPMPSAAWFANFQLPSPVGTAAAAAAPPAKSVKASAEVKFPAIAVKRVCVEERSLSTEQKGKHARWVQRRKKCLTGHKGYKCPAKSRAAKNKVRNNGRFDQKK